MSSSISNFRQLRVPLVAALVGVALLLLYHFVIVACGVQPGWVVTPFKLNEVQVERYTCSKKPAQVVAIGSSLLNRPASRITAKVFENLCLKGYCSLDGAEVIAKTRRYPKLLLIEIGHTLETSRRYKFEEELPSYRRALTRVTPVVLTQYQPASLMVRYIQETLYKPSHPDGRRRKNRENNKSNTELRRQQVETSARNKVARTESSTNYDTKSGDAIAPGVKGDTDHDTSPMNNTRLDTGHSTSTNSTKSDIASENGDSRTTEKTTDGTISTAVKNKDDTTSKTPAPYHHEQTAGRVDLVNPSFLSRPRDEDERNVLAAAVKYSRTKGHQGIVDPRRPDAPGSGQLPTEQRMSPSTRIRFLANLRRLKRYVTKFQKHGTVVYFVTVPESSAYSYSQRAEQHREIFERFFPKASYNYLEWNLGPHTWETMDGAHLTDRDAHLFSRFLVKRLTPVWHNMLRTREHQK